MANPRRPSSRRALPAQSIPARRPGVRSRRSIPIAQSLACILSLVAGCTQLPPAVPDVQILFDDDPGESVRTNLPEGADAYDAQARRLHLHAASGETIGFTCSLRGSGLNVAVGDLTSEEGQVLRGVAAVYRRHAVHVPDWPGWHIRSIPPANRVARRYDVLVPATAPQGGLPASGSARDPLKVWVDLGVPVETPAGIYRGKLEIRGGIGAADTIEVELTVWPFALPADSSVAMLANVDHRSLFAQHLRQNGKPLSPARILADDPNAAELESLLGAAMRLLREHRLTPQLRTLYPVTQVTADQGLSVDWSDYTRVVGPYVDGSAFTPALPLRVWPLPFDEAFPEPPAYGALESPTYSRLLYDYFASAAKCYREHGWIDRAVVRLPHAWPPGAAAGDAVRHFGQIIRDADRQVHIGAPLFPQNMAALGWYGYQHQDVRSFIDVWAPPAQFFDRAALSGAGQAWLVVDRPPFSGTTSLAGGVTDARVLGWQADAGSVSAIDLGTVNRWPKDDSSASPQACINADASVLLYPGTEFGLKGPVPSMRLKQLRRGMQDLAYLELLRKSGQEHIAVSVRQGLLSHFGVQAYGPHCADGRPDGWVSECAWWDLAVRIMADELVKAGGGGSQAGAAGLSEADLRWRRFMEGTRQVRVQPVGTRIRFVGVTPEEGIAVECNLALTNRQRAPLSAELRFDQLPVSWTASMPSRELKDIGPGENRGVVLAAEVSALGGEPSGILPLPLVFEEQGAEPRPIVARVAQVVAAPLAPAPKLDGDLSDWPIGAGNCASDFITLSGGAKPAHETLVYVGRVADKLYFAVRCPMAAVAGETVQTSDVLPDDGVLRGAESVEILLDPANAGTRSPADLYRLVIRTGGVRAEWGVTTSPPTSPARTWSPDVHHAVRARGDVWSAEIEIPLSAFPESYRTQSIWGFNVVRYDAAAQESSNWSGAVANVYDPLSLGNLLLP